ncbi:unnamed protein product [Mytilus coruscus]|uniref:Uncharacterized protein n=1 Tax=Mytilus coruscus TaxID=42192 RepID=A0A6J8A862_MYTCO|nr:unnamed protein product [Mytilus coruscus]
MGLYHNSRIQTVPANGQRSHHSTGYRNIPTDSINTNMMQNAHLYRQQYRIAPKPIPQTIYYHQGYSQQQTYRKEQSQRNINKRFQDQRTRKPADNSNADKEPTEEAGMNINRTNSAALITTKNDENKTHREVNHQVEVKSRTGYGGVAIVWKREINENIKELIDGGNRIQVIHIQQGDKPKCLINVYMPSDNKNADMEYRDTLAQIDERIEK